MEFLHDDTNDKLHQLQVGKQNEGCFTVQFTVAIFSILKRILMFRIHNALTELKSHSASSVLLNFLQSSTGTFTV